MNERTGSYAPLLYEIVESYGLEEKNNVLAEFIGLGESTVSQLWNGKKQLSRISKEQRFLLFICAGEKYKGHLYDFIKNSELGKELEKSMVANLGSPIDEKTKEEILKKFNNIDDKLNHMIDKFLQKLLCEYKKVNDRKELQPITKKQEIFIKTVQERFPSVYQQCIDEVDKKKDEDMDNREYAIRLYLLKWIREFSVKEQENDVEQEDDVQNKVTMELVHQLSQYVRENIYVETRRDCAALISEGKATYGTYYEYASCFFEMEKYPSSMENFMIAAEKGSADAATILGIWYLNGGLGIKRNHEESFKWLKKGAENKVGRSYPADSNWLARSLLGDAYYYGIGTKVDRTEAVRWYAMSINKEDEYDAELRYGKCLLYGYGIDKNIKEARETFARVMAKIYNIDGFSNDFDYDYRLALYYTGVCFYEEEKYADAIKTFKKVDDLAQTKNALGECYYYGKGHAVNKKLAIQLWHDAAEEQIDWAYYNLFLVNEEEKETDYYLKAYEIKQDVAYFIDEYRKKVVKEILRKWNKYLYGDGEKNEIKISEKYSEEKNIWRSTTNSNRRGITIYWHTALDQGESINLEYLALKNPQLIIIVADSAEIYLSLTKMEIVKNYIVVLTDLKHWTEISNGKNARCEKIRECVKKINNSILDYDNPRWIRPDKDEESVNLC